MQQSASVVPVAREIRFAVVMYGGVSLAIYENGIAQELLHLVRSTARDPNDPSQFRFNERGPQQPEKGKTPIANPRLLSPTEAIYRELAAKLSSEPQNNSVRFVIDVVSGTSAGGINGIFLAKALANVELMDGLKRLWVTEGDIGKLLNDGKSVADIDLPKPNPPAALLNGSRMYWKLLDAFDSMDQEASAAASNNPRTRAADYRSEPGLVDELDLFVTTTDIRGAITALRTQDLLVYERRHRFAFHFTYLRPRARKPGLSDEAGNDAVIRRINPDNCFEWCDNPFLAFAARCTSSFPFAFEPMRLSSMLDVLRVRSDRRQVRLGSWKSEFREEHLQEEELLGFKLETRSFGDGGYVDNKPFGYAIDALAHHAGVVPAERKLIYIEPTPEHPEREDARLLLQENTPPNAIQNSMAALITIPGYETIREDIMRVNERGRLVRKINELISFVSRSIGPETKFPSVLQPGYTPQVGSAEPIKSISEIAGRELMPASYYTLRVYDLTDTLVRIVADARGISVHSSYYYALRSLVRAWRERNYQSNEPAMPAVYPAPDRTETLIDYLRSYDLWFHLRRLRSVASEIALISDLKRNRETVRARLLAWKANAGPITNQIVDAIFTNQPDAEPFLTTLTGLQKAVNGAFNRLRDCEHDVKERIAKRLDVLPKRTEHPLLDKVLGVAAEGDGPGDSFRASFTSRERVRESDDQYVERARRYLDAHIKTEAMLKDPGETTLARLLDAIGREIGSMVAQAAKDADDTINAALSLSSDSKPAARAAVEFIRNVYSRFDVIDCAIFPVTYETEIGAVQAVDIIRFSPEDAWNLVDERKREKYKLAGSTLGHFGGFLNEDWRKYDIVWGRLDAAERIIRSLLPADAEEDANDLVQRAQNAILLEEFGDEAEDRLLADLESLPVQKGSVASQWIAKLKEKIGQHDRNTDVPGPSSGGAS